jgi:hypothetical protein
VRDGLAFNGENIRHRPYILRYVPHAGNRVT